MYERGTSLGTVRLHRLCQRAKIKCFRTKIFCLHTFFKKIFTFFLKKKNNLRLMGKIDLEQSNKKVRKKVSRSFQK